MKELLIKQLFNEQKLTYLFCILSYPRKFSTVDNISYLLRISFLIELTINKYIDIDFNSNNILILKRTDYPFYREFINKIEKKPINFKKCANALNGEFFSSKYSNLNIKKLRKRLLSDLKNFQLIEDFKIKMQKISVKPQIEVKTYLNTKILIYLLNYYDEEEDLLLDSLCILLELSGVFNNMFESLTIDQLEIIKNNLLLINRKINNGAGIKRPESIVFAFLRRAKK